MNKKFFFIGLLLGLLIALIGSFLFILIFTDLPFFESFASIKKNNFLGKVIALGTIIDLFFFAILLKINQDYMAKGVIAAVLLLTLFTLII